MNRIRAFFGRLAPLLGFRGSRQYWETRYRIGGHSGEGSRGKVATYKADVLNDFFRRHDVRSAVERLSQGASRYLRIYFSFSNTCPSASITGQFTILTSLSRLDIAMPVHNCQERRTLLEHRSDHHRPMVSQRVSPLSNETAKVTD